MRGHDEDAESLLRDSREQSRTVSYARAEAFAHVSMARFLAMRGQMEEASTHIERAESLNREIQEPDLTALCACCRSLLPDGDATMAAATLREHETQLTRYSNVECRYLLWRGSGERSHLEEAHRLLGQFREHAPEEYRESMVENVPLHRNIMRAWAEEDGHQTS
jgi:hypothetical protein